VGCRRAALQPGIYAAGALLIIPVILMYTAWSYYVFRGKVSGSEGYH
jgi:cytochrome bd-type quinol oxidase subunit 2